MLTRFGTSIACYRARRKTNARQVIWHLHWNYGEELNCFVSSFFPFSFSLCVKDKIHFLCKWNLFTLNFSFFIYFKFFLLFPFCMENCIVLQVEYNYFSILFFKLTTFNPLVLSSQEICILLQVEYNSLLSISQWSRPKQAKNRAQAQANTCNLLWRLINFFTPGKKKTPGKLSPT